MRVNALTDAVAVMHFAINVDRNGRAALAPFTKKGCSFDELAISRIGMQSLELQHQEED